MLQSNPSVKFTRRFESIHIMRGLAAFSVMLCHLAYLNEYFRARLPTFSSLFMFGGEGVWVFFIISGFAIPFSMREASYSFPAGAWSFFVRRMLRLQPPYVISVFFAAAIACVATVADLGEPFVLNIQNFVLQLVYLAPWLNEPWINGVSWTLAIEFQYYILMLFVGSILLSRSKITDALVFVIVIVFSIAIEDRRMIFVYLPFFSLGFIAFAYYARWLTKFWFIMLVAIFSVITIFKFSLITAAIAVISVVVILLPIRRPPQVFLFLGTISYSLYLVHMPIGDRIVYLTTRLPNLIWLQLLGLMTAIVVSIGVAILFWRLAEKPSISLSKNLKIEKFWNL